MPEKHLERVAIRPGTRPDKGYRYLYPKDEERVRNAYKYALENADVIERLGEWLAGNELRVPDDIRQMVDKAYTHLTARITQKSADG